VVYFRVIRKMGEFIGESGRFILRPIAQMKDAAAQARAFEEFAPKEARTVRIVAAAKA